MHTVMGYQNFTDIATETFNQFKANKTDIGAMLVFYWKYLQCNANMSKRTYFEYKPNIFKILTFSWKYFQSKTKIYPM